MSSTNVYRNTTAADYLNQLRLQQQSDLVGNTSQTNFTPLYIITESDTINITDAVSNNGNTQSQADIIDITDAVTETDYPAGASNLAGNAFKKLWLQFNNDTLDNSTNGNDGTVTYHSSLKALWAFGAQGSIKDATTNAFDLTLAAGTTKYARGKEGTALLFDGSTYYTASSSAVVSGTADRSFSFWVYLTSLSVNNGIFGYGVGTTSNACGCLIDTSGHIVFFGWANDVTSTSKLVLGTWYHVVLTLSSSGTVRKIYINGVLDTTSTTTALNTTAGTLSFGKDLPDAAQMQNGAKINQFRSYSIALSQAQVSALYMSGVIGSCHTFDGGEYITTGGASTFKFLSDGSLFSFDFWLQVPVGALSGTPVIFDNSGGGGFGNIGFTFFIRSTGEIDFQITNGGGVGPPLSVITSTGIYPNDGAWHHVIVTYDGTNGKIYLDSVLKQTTAKSGTYTFSSSNPAYTVHIGVRGDGAANFLTGQIDDLQVWNGYTLSQAEINYLYAKKDGWQVEEDADYQQLWLPLDNDVLDKSGNQNNGTITGTETYVAGPKTTKAFSFDGSTYILCGTGTTFNFNKSQPFSVALWIKTTNSSAQYLLEKTDNSELNGWIIYNPSPSDLRFYLMGTNSSTDALTVKTTTKINDGYWHHIVCTYDGSGSTSGMFIYVDGSNSNNSSLVNTLTTSGITNSNTLHVASRIDNLIEWNGQMSDVQLWNYALSQADINTLLGGQQIAHNAVVPITAKSDFLECVA